MGAEINIYLMHKFKGIKSPLDSIL